VVSVWPAWEVQEDESVTKWFTVRLAFPDGARATRSPTGSRGR